METRVEPQEVGRAGKGSPPQHPKASQKRNQLSDSPCGPLFLLTHSRTREEACTSAELDKGLPTRAAGSKAGSSRKRECQHGLASGPRPHPCTVAPGMQTHRQVFQVSAFIEGTGFYRGAPRACGEKPTIGLEGSGPAGSWRWVSKTCAETDKDRGECRPRVLRPHCRGCMLRATGRGRVRRGEVPGFT